MRTSRWRAGLVAVAAAALLGSISVAPQASVAKPLLSDLGGAQGLGVTRSLLPARAAAEYSLNWAGYVQKASGITDVRGGWIVPSASIVVPSFSVTWVGIGGDPSQDLIQAGTMSSSIDGYYAWYEMLPDSLIPITAGCFGDASCKVVPGDQVNTAIWNGGGDLWHIAMENVGKWAWGRDVSYHSTYSSAEWIFEAPTVGVQTIPQHVGVQRFLPGGSFVVNGNRRAINSGSPVITYISPIGILNLATPSVLTPSGAFNVCTYAQSCAAPAS